MYDYQRLPAFAPAPWTYKDTAGAGLQIHAPVHLVTGLKLPDGMPREPIFIYSLRETSGYMGIGDERWVQFEPDGWHEMQLANARLISAAPDLFNAIFKSDDAHWTPAMRAAMKKAVGEE